VCTGVYVLVSVRVCVCVCVGGGGCGGGGCFEIWWGGESKNVPHLQREKLSKRDTSDDL